VSATQLINFAGDKLTAGVVDTDGKSIPGVVDLVSWLIKSLKITMHNKGKSKCVTVQEQNSWHTIEEEILNLNF
jgi:hypothetical protein